MTGQTSRRCLEVGVVDMKRKGQVVCDSRRGREMVLTSISSDVADPRKCLVPTLLNDLEVADLNA